jgi:hypothetical protein
MRQRGFGLITFLPYAIMAVVGLLAWWQWADFKEDLREEGRAEVRAEWQEERTKLLAARDAMVMRWAAAIQTVERVYVEKVVERETKFAGIRERAGTIKPATDAVVVPVSPDAGRVLGDIAAAANGPAPAQGDSGGAAAVPDAAGGDAQTTLTDWLEFSRQAGEAYRDVYERFILARGAALACHQALEGSADR